MMAKKPRRGRPPKKPNEVRDRELRIRINADEERTLSKAGADNLSEWARDVLLAAAARLTKAKQRD